MADLELLGRLAGTITEIKLSSVANPIPDPRHEPRPWRPEQSIDNFDWDGYYRQHMVDIKRELLREYELDRYEIRPFSDWLDALVRMVGDYIVEAVLRMGPGAIIAHWVADGVQPQINMEA